MIDANQYQGRVKRYRREGISSHAMDLAFLVDGDDCDSGGKRTHRFAEVGIGEVHCTRPRWSTEPKSYSLSSSASTVRVGDDDPKIVAIEQIGGRIQGTRLGQVRYSGLTS
jgi:hypothetical protein